MGYVTMAIVKREAVNVTPVLLGADLNCYNVARAFHEEYGVCSYAFGRYAIGATKDSKIVNFKAVPSFDQTDVMLTELSVFAKEHEGENLILMGCTDDYVNLIVKNREKLKDRYIIPYISEELMADITLKAKFYEYCDKYGILYPKTKVIEKGDSIADLPFEYPIIIKPSSSILYWKYPFDGMKKVYRAKNEDEAKKIINKIYGSGYPEKLILQDTIPGDDSRMYVLTSYSDKHGKVKMMCLGHVLLEEHTPKGLGNHCAIITEDNPQLMKKFKTFLEEIGFVGFSNFDIKYDNRDGSYRAFEINTRQGRSNYYVTASGNNIARYVTKDFLLDEDLGECVYNSNKIYWRYVPDSVVNKYVSMELRSEIKALKKAKKAYSSMRYSYDLKFNFKRSLYVFLHEKHHIGKFRKYYRV